MKTDRNALCPCGSGIKFKKCHGSPLRVASPVAEPASTRAHLVPDKLFAQALEAHTGGDFSSAEALYRELLAAHPKQPDVLHNLGLVLLQQGDSARALELLERAVSVVPKAAFKASLAAAMVSAGRYADAIVLFDSLTAILDARGLQNFAVALGRLGRVTEARDICNRALQMSPTDADLHGLLGNLHTDAGEFGEAQKAYEKALQLRVDAAAVHSNMLLMQNYSDLIDATTLLERHAQYGLQHSGVWEALPRLFSNELETDRPLRIGFISPDFGEHPVGYLVEPLLEALDKSRFELFLYATRHRDDPLSKRLRAQSSAWRACHAMVDAELVSLIRSDRIDVLVDLAGHTAGNRLPVMARRPAPVQVTYLGYPTTTGLASMDYRISDATIDPEGTASGVEQLIRLAGGMFRYRPPLDAPEPSASPRAGSAVATFGCFCNLSKVTQSSLDLWCQVLQATPGARFVLKAAALADEALRERILASFEARGVDRARVDLLGWTEHAQHLADYSRLDVMLDTVPFNLAGNTCEALWMGVPVVSLCGDRPAARMGASILQSAGMADWIARDQASFVRIASELATDAAALARLRAGQRERLRQSSLLDGASQARELASALQTVYARWAEGRSVIEGGQKSVLHVGCGSPEAGKLPPYFAPDLWREVRLDIDVAVKPDFVASMTDMSVVPTASMHALYSSHNVEHLYAGEVPRALAEFKRVLVPGGFALITVPDLRAAAERVLREEQELPAYNSPAGPISALDMIYGYAPFIEGGNHFMIHKTGFTARTLAATLQRAGFERVTVRSSGFALWAVAYAPGA